MYPAGVWSLAHWKLIATGTVAGSSNGGVGGGGGGGAGGSGGGGGGGGGGGSGSELPALDTYGSGPNADEIAAEVASSALPITMHGAIDHAHPSIHGYRLFVNPSTSDVLCTATAEALAMGKKVLIPRPPNLGRHGNHHPVYPPLSHARSLTSRSSLLLRC